MKTREIRWKDLSAVLILVTIWSAAQIFFGEKIPQSLNQGLGWDGYLYGQWAMNFWDAVRIHLQPSDYSVQRILPSAVVHYCLRLIRPLGSISPRAAVLGFSVFNLFFIQSAVVMWFSIARQLQLSSARFYAGCIFLLGNFLTLKLAFFYSNLTDMWAYGLGLLSVWGVILRRVAIVWTAALLAAFVWPVAALTGWVMIACWGIKIQTPEKLLNIRQCRLFGLASGVVVAVLTSWRWTVCRTDPTFGVAPGLGFWWVPLSIGLFSVYSGACATILLNEFPKGITFSKGSRAYGGLAVATWLAVKIAQSFLSNGQPIAYHSLLDTTLTRAVSYPLVFLVAHVVYFGPALLLIYWNWTQISGWIVHRMGVSGIAWLVCFLPWTVASESRAWISFFPVLPLALAAIMPEKYFSPRSLFFFALLGFLYSKAWLPINHPNFASDPTYLVSLDNYQRYFMNFGSAFNNSNYLLALALCASASLATYLILKLTTSKLVL